VRRKLRESEKKGERNGKGRKEGIGGCAR